MELANELIQKARTAKTAEELLEMAKAEGVELSQEEAARYFSEFHKTGELSDDELDNVAGGCDDYQSGDSAKFSVGQRVYYIDAVYVMNSGYEYNYCYGTVIEIHPKKDGVFNIEVQMDTGGTRIFAENKLKQG
ncbi:MAG: hypothetical protein ACI4MH_01750 [Candidatus Coproplasma sp.]